MISTLITNIGLGVTLLLIFLLVQRELLQAYGDPHTKGWIRVLDITIIPLLVAFGIVAIIRLLY